MPGRRKDLAGRALFDDETALHHRNTVADLGRDPQIVRDKEHREVELAAHLVQQLQHLVLHRDVQRRDRLVADQEFRLHGQRTRNADALALAAGELVRVAVDRVRRQVHHRHQVAGALQGFLAREAEIHRALDDGFADGAARIERAVGILKNELHPPPHRAEFRFLHRGDVDVVDPDRAAGRLHQPRDAARHGRLAGTGFADNAERFAAPHRQRNVADRVDDPRLGLEQRALAVGLEQFLGLQHHRPAHRRAFRRRHARHRGQQHPGVVLAGIAQHFLAGALLHDAAHLHHHDAIGDLGDHAEIMGDEQHAGLLAALHFLHEFKDLRLRRDIERRGRLIRDQQRGIEHQGRRDHDALALAAGELMRIGVDHLLGIRQMHGTHHLQHALAPRLRVEAGVDLQHLGDLVADPLDRIECGHRLLKHHGHAGAAQRAQLGVGFGGQFLALQPHRTGLDLHRVLRQQAHHRLRGDGFSGTGFTDDADDLVGVDGQVNAAHGVRPVATALDGDGKIGDFEDGFRHVRPASPSWDLACRATRRPAR